jgi:hypothetical protein
MFQPPFDPAIRLFPESATEHLLLRQPEFLEGLFWGEPRFGHPEGQVVYHVEEILRNIDGLPVRFSSFREKLRLIAYVHDTFKYREDKNLPRDWTKHHGILARQFFEKFCDEKAVLEIIELHDEAYYCWRIFAQQQMRIEGLQSLDRLFRKIEPFLQLYYLFFWCDTSTGDKNPAPLKWFEQMVAGIDVV